VTDKHRRLVDLARAAGNGNEEAQRLLDEQVRNLGLVDISPSLLRLLPRPAEGLWVDEVPDGYEVGMSRTLTPEEVGLPPAEPVADSRPLVVTSVDEEAGVIVLDALPEDDEP
jgi:hypothetical protein